MAVENRDRFVGIKLKPSEYEEIKKAADKAGVRISEYLRGIIVVKAIKDNK